MTDGSGRHRSSSPGSGFHDLPSQASSFESSRPAVAGDVEYLVTLAVKHAESIASERGADLLLRRELPSSQDELTRQLEAAVDSDRAFLVVGCFAGFPFGYGLVYFEKLADGDCLARLEHLLVEPEARGVGIGESIMNTVVDEAKNRGCLGIDSRALPGDRQTKNFFESFGLKARQLVVHYRFETEHPTA